MKIGCTLDPQLNSDLWSIGKAGFKIHGVWKYLYRGIDLTEDVLMPLLRQNLTAIPLYIFSPFVVNVLRSQYALP